MKLYPYNLVSVLRVNRIQMSKCSTSYLVLFFLDIEDIKHNCKQSDYELKNI